MYYQHFSTWVGARARLRLCCRQPAHASRSAKVATRLPRARYESSRRARTSRRCSSRRWRSSETSRRASDAARGPADDNQTAIVSGAGRRGKEGGEGWGGGSRKSGVVCAQVGAAFFKESAFAWLTWRSRLSSQPQDRHPRRGDLPARSGRSSSCPAGRRRTLGSRAGPQSRISACAQQGVLKFRLADERRRGLGSHGAALHYDLVAAW